MDFSPVIKAISDKCVKMLIDEPMSRHTSFRIGGPAAVMVLPNSTEELKSVCEIAKRFGADTLLMGNGSNLLVTDAPLPIIVIKTFDGMGRIEHKGNKIYAESGVLLSRLSVFAQQHGFTGLEFAHGIPGTVGGAIFMNAGAYGGEMKDVVLTTEFFDEEMNLSKVSGSEHDFSYRHSVFSNRNSIITSAIIDLARGDKDEILARMQELSKKRKSSQPLDMPSAGSTFKRPKNGYAAAMIEQAGLKGLAVGGAQVSEKHAGFIVNRGGATFDDVRKLMDIVCERVFSRFGTQLVPEVRIICGKESLS